MIEKVLNGLYTLRWHLSTTPLLFAPPEHAMVFFFPSVIRGKYKCMRPVFCKQGCLPRRLRIQRDETREIPRRDESRRIRQINVRRLDLFVSGEVHHDEFLHIQAVRLTKIWEKLRLQEDEGIKGQKLQTPMIYIFFAFWGWVPIPQTQRRAKFGVR